MNPAERIIVAADVSTSVELAHLARTLAPLGVLFKIGLEAITSLGGARAINDIQEYGGRVFYDGKFADIPNTVAKSSAYLAGLNVAMFNVHASCGWDSLDAAVANRGDAKVLAVTVLTSLDDYLVGEIFGDTSKNKVLQFATRAYLHGCDGIICSPQELPFLMEDAHAKKLLKVTPGVRPEWAPANDQKRIMTPGDAIKAGADYLVIGRPITSPPDGMNPVEAAQRIAEEIKEALSGTQE